MLLTAIKSVSACSVGINPDNPLADPYAEINESFFYTKIYFYSLIFLILANFVLFFLRRQKDYPVLFAIISTLLIMIPATFIATLIQDCGALIGFVMKWEFIIFLIIFGFHICLWVNKTGLHLRGEGLTLTKLR